MVSRFVFPTLFSSVAFAAAPVILEEPCLNELVIEGRDSRHRLRDALTGKYSVDTPVGEIRTTVSRNRPGGPGTPLVVASTYRARTVAMSLRFEGLSGVRQDEQKEEGQPSTFWYSKTDGDYVLVWMQTEKERAWHKMRAIHTPEAQDGLRWQVVTRYSNSGPLRQVVHHRWQYVGDFTTPFGGQRFKKVFAMVTERVDLYDEKGKPKKNEHPSFSVTYYLPNFGGFYSCGGPGAVPEGFVAAPDEAKMDSDQIVYVDSTWR